MSDNQHSWRACPSLFHLDGKLLLFSKLRYLYFGCSGIGIKLRFIRPWITSMQVLFLDAFYPLFLVSKSPCSHSFFSCFQNALSLQIAQFVTGMSFLWFAYSSVALPGGECVRPSATQPGGNPGMSFAFVFQFFYVGSVLFLFSHFFASEYLTSKDKENGAAAAKSKKAK